MIHTPAIDYLAPSAPCSFEGVYLSFHVAFELIMGDLPTNSAKDPIIVGVLALQGAFSEHVQLLRKAAAALIALDANASSTNVTPKFLFEEIRTAEQLTACDALIVPGGESTAISLVAVRSGLMDALREFVK